MKEPKQASAIYIALSHSLLCGIIFPFIISAIAAIPANIIILSISCQYGLFGGGCSNNFNTILTGSYYLILWVLILYFGINYSAHIYRKKYNISNISKVALYSTVSFLILRIVSELLLRVVIDNALLKSLAYIYFIVAGVVLNTCLFYFYSKNAFSKTV